jgi:hypothetical protein
MQKDVTDNLQTLQDGFVSGKTPLDELQSGQGKRTALDSSINALRSCLINHKSRN